MSIWKATLTIHDALSLPLTFNDGASLSDVVARMLRAPGGEWGSQEDALFELLSLERQGFLSLESASASDALSELLRLVDALDKALDADPGLHNLIGDHRGWTDDPDHYDFVASDTALGHLKRFERDLYLKLLDPFLETLPERAHILDAGCGPGRFVEPMLSRGFRVHLVDASKDALHRALAHALHSGGHAQNLDAHVAHIDDLHLFPDQHFDAVLSMEVICYRGAPLRALRELARVTKVGGLIMLSVEGVYGAMMVSEGASPATINQALLEERLTLHRDAHVTYYSEASLSALMHEAGLEPLCVEGSHYVCEGPFARSVDLERLEDGDHRQEIFDLEARCQRDPVLRPLARAWVGVGRRI